MDEDLEKIWICHRSIENLSRFLSSLNDDHFEIQCDKIHSNPYTELEFVFKEVSQSHFSPRRIYEGILTKLHCCLAQYVLSECLVLYNWGINSFELVFDNEEFCMRLLKYQNYCKGKMAFKMYEDDFRKWRMILTSQRKNARFKRNSCDLFEEEERKMLILNQRRKRKLCKYRELKRIYRDCNKSWQRNNQRNMEVFNMDRILYDMNQRLWPREHALSASTPEEFLNAIMETKIKEKTNYGRSYHIQNEWLTLKRILGIFLKNHKSLALFGGYGRLLKRHLKVTGFSAVGNRNRKLQPIPTHLVSSYIAIILHRVVPFEFFGTNRIRKKFFRETSRIICGGKGENFILKPFIETFLDVKNNLSWIREVQNWEVARRITSKIVKWLLLDYIFLILKNHFYITDVGSSCYRLYYYRKNDVEGAVSRLVNNQIRLKNLRKVEGDLDHWKSVERKWLETGKIELNRNDGKMKMDGGTEYISPAANVRFLPKTEEIGDLRIITHYQIKRTILRKEDVKKRQLLVLFTKRHVKRTLMLRKVKLLLRFLTDKYGTGIAPMPHNPKLELAWARAVYLKEVYGKLYYIKADVSDAFGSVLPSLLGAIIEEKLRVESNQVLQLKKMKECRVRNGRLECVMRKSFTDRPTENSLLVCRSNFVGSRKKLPSYSSALIKGVLDQVIQNQYLRINGKLYRLMKGLTQGSAGSISPLLCDIYYSEMDRLYFGEFTWSSNCILLRAVDDYLLFTSDLTKARKFFEIVRNGIKEFSVTFNKSKLKSNLIDGSSSSVNYLGLIFDVEKSSVRPDYRRYMSNNLLSTMKLSDPYGIMYSRKMRFLLFRSLCLVSLKLLPVTLNSLYVTPSVVRNTVYAACIVQSNRILVLTRLLIRGKEKNDLDVCIVLSKTLQKIAATVTRLNRDVTQFEISWLFWKAAFYVFRKYSGAFPALLTLISHRINVLERRPGRHSLLDTMKAELPRMGDAQEILKIITMKSKPSRFL